MKRLFYKLQKLKAYILKNIFNMYSQNSEEQYILDYFKEKTFGRVLDVGANDGKTFSNSLALIERGWEAVLCEPSPIAFEKLVNLHKDTSNRVCCVMAAIGEQQGKTTLHQSGAHLKNQSDVALLSTIHENETEKWKRQGVVFNDVECEVITIDQLQQIVRVDSFDFITIDCEGNDLKVLQQIDLTNTSLVCVEWNENELIKNSIIEYCARYGLNKVIYVTGENILIGR
ncbi:MAG TPA: FkbM family methyltransferase [Flavobacteriales bacterium]|nr:FkbM family methyltransferase [Flavobacteriales bacterium]